MEELTITQENVLKFLEEFIREKGFPPTLREIASHFGLRGPRGPQKTLRSLEKRGFLRRVPGSSRAIEILKHGDKAGRPGRSTQRPLDLARGLEPFGLEQLRAERSIERLSTGGLSYTPQVISVPMVGRVRAGEPILAIENIEGYISFDRSLVRSDDVFLLRVQGDSMIGAHIQDGDFALVRPQPDAENGEIVVALIEDEATVKRIFKTRDLIRLEPSNPNIEPIVVKRREKRVSIVGKVVGIFRRM